MKHGSITHEGAAPDFFKGAFLVSATLRDGLIEEITIPSEACSDLTVDLPWDAGTLAVDESAPVDLTRGTAHLTSKPGQTFVLRPAG